MFGFAQIVPSMVEKPSPIGFKQVTHFHYINPFSLKLLVKPLVTISNCAQPSAKNRKLNKTIFHLKDLNQPNGYKLCIPSKPSVHPPQADFPARP